jgi:hypothetical protein
MSSQKDHEYMEKLDRCYKLVQQSSVKGGIRAVEIADKMSVHKTTVHKYLNSLQYMGKVESDQGLWKAKTGEQTIKPLEKEIVIELPLPKNQVRAILYGELIANYSEDVGSPEIAKMYRTMIETLNKTRTIKIRGKNVDDLDLEKIAVMTQQANEKSSKINLKGLLKKLKP